MKFETKESLVFSIKASCPINPKDEVDATEGENSSITVQGKPLLVIHAEEEAILNIGREDRKKYET
jgi:hypothetical protein